MIESIKTNLLWTEGLPIVLVLSTLAVVTFIFLRPFFYITFLLFAFSFYFFRNPKRVCKEVLNNSSLFVCPADGKVVGVNYDKNSSFDGFSQRVSIFLSPFDVHVNWAPVDGVVEKVVYKPGQFKMAFLPKSSELNERNDVCITAKNGKKMVVRQIAGTIARQICCWVKDNQDIKQGQKYGMIRFGSRVDILLPDDAIINVGVGQRVYGGKTVLGRWK